MCNCILFQLAYISNLFFLKSNPMESSRFERYLKKAMNQDVMELNLLLKKGLSSIVLLFLHSSLIQSLLREQTLQFLQGM